MSDTEVKKREVWAAKLGGDVVDDQVDALRQISSEECVVGLAVPIVALTASGDEEVRMWSAEALESAVQPLDCEISPLALLLEQNTDGEIGYWAATMLGRLGSGAATAAASLESCLRESMYLPAREQATWALREIGPPAAIALESLTEAAESAPPRLRRLAAEAIRAISASGPNNEGGQHPLSSGEFAA